MDGLPRRMPSNTAIVGYWAPRLNKLRKFRSYDLKKGECFACGCVAQLDRAHINAKGEGGSDDVSNIHLLCHICHWISEPLSGLIYWRWFLRWNADRKAFAMLSIYEATGALARARVKIDKFLEDGTPLGL